MTTRQDPVTGNFMCSGGGQIPNLTPEQWTLAYSEKGAASVAGSIRATMSAGHKFTTFSNVLFPSLLEKLTHAGVLRRKLNASRTGVYFTFTNITNVWCNTALALDDQKKNDEGRTS